MFSLSKTLGILPTLSSNLSASGPLKHYGNYSLKHQSLSSLHGNGYTVQSNKIKPTNISWESVMCNCVDYKAKFSNIPRRITHQECGFIPGFTLGVAKA